MERLNWAILGTGKIGHRFAEGLKKSKTGRLAVIGSRNAETALAFAARHGGKGFGSYDAALNQPEVDAVYISLPHHMHKEWTIRCAEANKHILCEKPFTLTAEEAKEALEAVRAAEVFFMEAFMYRCHPQTQRLRQLVEQGAIGKVMAIHSEFGYATARDWQNFRRVKEVGGGALMDVGCYCISMCRMIAGEEPGRCEYDAQFAPEGYDAVGTGLLAFPSGVRASFATAMHAQLRNDVRIYGSDGWIHVPSPWFCEEAVVLHSNNQKPRKFSDGSSLDLYGNESDVVAANISAKEAPQMTWEDTLFNMTTLDAMRRSAGLAF